MCFMDDVCRALRISRRTLERMRRLGPWPIRELPVLDKRPRWSGADVERFICEGRTGPRRGRQ